MTDRFHLNLIAIGLEVADDSILKKLNKGFTLQDIVKALFILDEMEIFSRAYILVGPPFVENAKVGA